MSLSQEQQQQFTAVLTQAGLGAAVETCLRHARGAYTIVVTDPDAAQLPLGATRFGGTPDLPNDTEWPRDDDGKVGNFFAQLDLADLAVRAPGSGLPESGLLSLFTTYLESAAEPVVVAAILTPAGSELARLMPPEDDDDYADPYTGYLEPVAVGFEPSISLPLDQKGFVAELAAALDDEDGIYTLRELLDEKPDAAIGQLGGFGDSPSGGDFRRILYFHRHGHPEAQWSDHYATREEYLTARAGAKSDGDHVVKNAAEFEWIFDNAEQIAAESERWALLLRIDSNHPMELSINDWDPIYFYAPADEIAAGDVASVEAMVTQG
jgi:hypothetical protein